MVPISKDLARKSSSILVKSRTCFMVLADIEMSILLSIKQLSESSINDFYVEDAETVSVIARAR